MNKRCFTQEIMKVWFILLKRSWGDGVADRCAYCGSTFLDSDVPFVHPKKGRFHKHCVDSIITGYYHSLSIIRDHFEDVTSHGPDVSRTLKGDGHSIQHGESNISGMEKTQPKTES